MSQAIKFNGEDAYLSRTTDLTGWSDESTGIISFWVRPEGLSGDKYIFTGSDSSGDHTVLIRFTSGNLSFLIGNQGSAWGVDFTTAAGEITESSTRWHHILVCFNIATSICKVFIDDVKSTATASFSTGVVQPTGDRWAIGRLEVTASLYCSSALQYLYYNPGAYLDFDTQTNREKFADFDANDQFVPVDLGSDGSTPTASQPIVYFPLIDISTANENAGSGGDFTTNGTLEYASTDPTTPSVEAVDYIALSEYLTRAGGYGAADGRKVTFSFWIKEDTRSNNTYAFDGGSRFSFYTESDPSIIRVLLRNTSGVNVAAYDTTTSHQGKGWHHVMFSCDFTSAFTKHLYLDDVSSVSTVLEGTLADIDFTPAGTTYVGYRASGSTTVQIAELFVDVGTYLDLSIESNRRKFITADGEPANPRQLDGVAGLSPEVYLPNPAATANENVGSGGDFTVTGTLEDAKSTPLYYYAESADFDGSADYLTRASTLTGGGDSKNGTLSFFLKVEGGDGTARTLFHKANTGTFLVQLDATNKIQIQGENAAGTTILDIETSTAVVAADGWVHFMASWDLATTTAHVYLDNASDKVETTVTNDTLDYTDNNWAIGANYAGTSKFDGVLTEFYWDDGYIDLSLSANRDKFVMTNLRPAGNLVVTTGAAPMLYFAKLFDAFEENLGAGGDFSVTGALTSGITSPGDVGPADIPIPGVDLDFALEATTGEIILNVPIQVPGVDLDIALEATTGTIAADVDIDLAGIALDFALEATQGGLGNEISGNELDLALQADRGVVIVDIDVDIVGTDLDLALASALGQVNIDTNIAGVALDYALEITQGVILAKIDSDIAGVDLDLALEATQGVVGFEVVILGADLDLALEATRGVVAAPRVADTRNYIVPSRDRTYKVPLRNRTYVV